MEEDGDIGEVDQLKIVVPRLRLGGFTRAGKEVGDILDAPIDLIGELASKMTADEWIALYEEKLKR